MHNTIFNGLLQYSEIAPAAPALVSYGRKSLTYAALRDHISSFVSSLNGLGIGRGDRVALLLPNGPEMATACLSVMAGAVAAPLNPDYKQPEYAAMFRRLAPKALLIQATADHPARKAANSLGIRVLDVQPIPDAPAGVFRLSTGSPVPHAPDWAQADDVALVLQTSGTTAQPKVVPLSHRNLLASATHLAQSLGLGTNDRVLHFLPLFHIGGIVDVLAAPLIKGGMVICASSFSAPTFLRDLTEFNPTWAQAVPVMLEEMLANAQSVTNHSLRFVRSVSAPLAPAQMEAFENAFSIPVIEIYGMTETAGVITSNPLPPGIRLPGSVGIAAGAEIRILDATGLLLSNDTVGEIVVRGNNVMSGYENAPEENALAFVDGWFRTGDLGFLNAEGYLFITGRIKDMINRGGEKVSPHEVDQALLSHPMIADAAAFAIPHSALGEDVAAIVVLKDGSSLTKESLTEFLKDRLAFFKIPKALHFVEQVPRSPNGKLQRALLTKIFSIAQQDAAVSRPDFVETNSPVAKMLASLWSGILKVDVIGMNDDFFDLGGDSLKAASFINALQQKWGDTIYVSSIFDAPTLAKYERYLRQHYPEIVARVLGEIVTLKQSTIGKVTPEMVQQLKGMIAHPVASKPRPIKKNPPAIFVLSPPRSGSTLLRAMLAGHPKLFAPPELYLLSYDNLAERKQWFSGSHRSELEGNIRALMQVRGESAETCHQLMTELEENRCPTQDYYQMLQEWIGNRILVDKTPAYAVDPETLRRAESQFDNPIFIHLLRHPYGMIRSFEEAKLDQLWFFRLMGTDSLSLDAFPFERRQLAEMVWLILHQNILSFLQDVPAERQYRLRFEDMVGRPESAMTKLCAALGLDFEPAMLEPQGDKKQRMTDGLHDVSRMIGDPKFHQFKKIESAVADQWKHAYEVDFLSEETSALASSIGYTETIAEAHGRTEIEI